MEALTIDILDEYMKMNVSNFLDTNSLLSFTEVYPQLKTACKQFGSIHEITKDNIQSIHFDMIIYDVDYSMMERAIHSIRRYFGSSCTINFRIRKTIKVEMQVFDISKFISMFGLFYQINRFLIQRSCFCLKIMIKDLISDIKSKHIMLNIGNDVLIPLDNIDSQKQRANIDMSYFFKSAKSPYIFSQGICETRVK